MSLREPERFQSISLDCSLTNYFELCYGVNQKDRLQPLKPILDKNLVIEIIDNKDLSISGLLLKPKDHDPIKILIPATGDLIRLNHVGKSARLDFDITPITHQSHLNNIIDKEFNINLRSSHHLHSSTVGDINNVGWTAFWAPIQDIPLPYHVRLVANRTIENGSDPDVSDARRLASVFNLKA